MSIIWFTHDRFNEMPLYINVGPNTILKIFACQVLKDMTGALVTIDFFVELHPCPRTKYNSYMYDLESISVQIYDGKYSLNSFFFILTA